MRKFVNRVVAGAAVAMIALGAAECPACGTELGDREGAVAASATAPG